MQIRAEKASRGVLGDAPVALVLDSKILVDVPVALLAQDDIDDHHDLRSPHTHTRLEPLVAGYTTFRGLHTTAVDQSHWFHPSLGQSDHPQRGRPCILLTRRCIAWDPVSDETTLLEGIS